MRVAKTFPILCYLFFCPILCFSQDVILISQAQVDAFDPQTNHINGDLHIGHTLITNNITDLSNLSNLIYITGSLTIVGNTELKYLSGLYNLQAITGDLNIFYNNKLLNINGLSNLVSIARDINIWGNEVLIDCCGIRNLLQSQGGIGGVVTIANNPSECSSEPEIINSDCSTAIFLTSQAEVDAFDPKITEIKKGLFIGTIEGSTDIFDLSNLFNLTSVSNFFIIVNNGVLQNVDGFTNLTSIPGYLFIRYNDVLTNVDGFSNLSSISGKLDVRDNEILTDCCGIQQILNNSASIGGDITIENNLSECSSQQEIIDADCTTANENLPIKEFIVFGDFPDRFQFSITDVTIISARWQLVNVSGANIKSGTISNIREIVIQKDEMVPGMYFFSANVDGNPYTRKIVVID